jgi:pyruvate dehydrogenase phosphatase
MPKGREEKERLLKIIPKDDRRVTEEDFVVLDENCTTHSVGNALLCGGEEVLCAIVGAASLFSGNARDDMTVQVNFFDDK